MLGGDVMAKTLNAKLFSVFKILFVNLKNNFNCEKRAKQSIMMVLEYKRYPKPPGSGGALF